MTTGASGDDESDFDAVEHWKEFQTSYEQLRLNAAQNPENGQEPPSYLRYVKDWYARDAWTVTETANLLCGFAPTRPTGLPGLGELDARARTREREIERCLGQSIRVIESPARFFGGPKRHVNAADVVPWAEARDYFVPLPMLQAHRKAYRIPDKGLVSRASDILAQHTTPDITILLWVINEYWISKVDGPRPKKEVIVERILEEFGDIHRIARSRAETIDSLARPVSERRGGTRARPPAPDRKNP